MTLKQLIHSYGSELLGTEVHNKYGKEFPLLIKILDATQFLSVQVHPSDDYAAVHEGGQQGKTEMWYIIQAQPGASLIYDIVPGTTRDDFEKAIRNGQLEKYLKSIEVRSGDVLYIPAGVVHAIGPGILICEIQQNSDTTYRVYDWNRLGDDGKPRALHIAKALDVIDFTGSLSRGKLSGLSIEEEGGIRTYYVACRHFAMEKLECHGGMKETTDGSKFFTLTAVEGRGEILHAQGSQTFKSGDSVLIPACLGEYHIHGDCTIIKAYVPDRESDIIAPLLARGFAVDQLMAIAGLFEGDDV
jgi:mannose-6-phosphate isomerase